MNLIFHNIHIDVWPPAHSGEVILSFLNCCEAVKVGLVKSRSRNVTLLRSFTFFSVLLDVSCLSQQTRSQCKNCRFTLGDYICPRN